MCMEDLERNLVEHAIHHYAYVVQGGNSQKPFQIKPSYERPCIEAFALFVGKGFANRDRTDHKKELDTVLATRGEQR